MVQYLEKLILDNWGDWFETDKPKKLDFLKIHAGQAIRNKKVGFFVFNKNKPLIFAKTVREDKHNKIIEDGFERLKGIYKYLNDGSVPKPLYLGNYQELMFSLETAISGKQFHSCKKEKDLEKFLEWFFRFQKLMSKKEKMVGIKLEDYIDELVAKFLGLYGLEKKLKELIREISQNLKNDISNLSLLLISQHGDLTPDNVLNDEGKIRVIDWDNFEKIKLPLFDLLAFLQRWRDFKDTSFIVKDLAIIKKYLNSFKIEKRALRSLVFCYYLLDFIRKKEVLTGSDKKRLETRLKEIKEVRFKL